jgi:hypothetical protein
MLTELFSHQTTSKQGTGNFQGWAIVKITVKACHGVILLDL